MRLILKVTFDPKSRQRVYRLWDNSERRVDDLISHKDKTDRHKHIVFKAHVEYLIEQFDKLFGVKLTMDDYCHWFGVTAINFMAVGNRKSIKFQTTIIKINLFHSILW